MCANDLGPRFDAWVQPLVESGYLSGVLLVARGDSVILNRAWGMANLEHGVPNASATPFAIASLSKPMTTVALLRLVERGAIGLQDSVARWIPDFPYGDQITVTDLVTHRARIPHRVTEPSEETVPMTPADIVARIVEQGLPGPPDGSRAYSSAGYAVLARIIEIASGTSYAEAMEELVFEPLGMNDTEHTDSRNLLKGRASDYLPGPIGLVPAPLKDLSFLAGGGSLWSTAPDVLRFALACMDRRLLSEAAWAQFHALGWARSDVTKWNGSNGGWYSFLDLYKQQDLLVVFLGNAAMGPTFQIREAVPRWIAGETVDVARGAPPAADVHAAEWSDLSGVYTDGGATEMRVDLDRGSLWLNGSALRPLGGSHFFNPAFWIEVDFAVEGAGVKELRLLIPGNTRTYTREGG